MHCSCNSFLIQCFQEIIIIWFLYLLYVIIIPFTRHENLAPQEAWTESFTFRNSISAWVLIGTLCWLATWNSWVRCKFLMLAQAFHKSAINYFYTTPRGDRPVCGCTSTSLHCRGAQEEESCAGRASEVAQIQIVPFRLLCCYKRKGEHFLPGPGWQQPETFA